jgi:hypothetical protein
MKFHSLLTLAGLSALAPKEKHGRSRSASAD